jgi:hypothetical protein
VKVPEVLAEYRDHDDGSLSTQDQHAFNRDIWVNARQIEERWREERKGLTEARRRILSNVYDHCARFFFGEDQVVFEQAVQRIGLLDPGQMSATVERYLLGKKILGYKKSSTVKGKVDFAKSKAKNLVKEIIQYGKQ